MMAIRFVRKYVLGNSSNSEYSPHIFLVLCFYAIFLCVYAYLVSESVEHLVVRIIVGGLILVTFVVLERVPIANGLRAFLSPFLIIFYITAGAFYLSGDFLIYTYTIGCAMISLTYLKPRSVMIYSGLIFFVQLIVIVVFGVNLMGENFRQVQNFVGTFAALGTNVFIFLFCRHYANTLAALIDAKNAASNVAVSKSIFLSNMSHEIRTPLNAIIGMTVIGKNAKDETSALTAINKIEKASMHLLGVVNNVLDMAKMESGKLELSIENFCMEKTIERVSNIMSHDVGKKMQEFHVSIDENMPYMLEGDDLRLAQVLINLLGNAVKFTPQNGKIELSAKLQKEEDGLCTIEFRVTDTGIGISKEQQTGLFNAFFQAEVSTAHKFGGTGLGLAISKNIIEMMGGTLSVESELGNGASFIFVVQMKRGILANPAPPSDSEPEDTTAYSTKHILLVEDISINREIVMAFLEPIRVKITAAENGVQAVQIFAENPSGFDLIFMDLQMPEMDGFTATRKIRAMDDPKAKTIPIIAMTANVLSEDVQKCLAAGMNSHIGKPIDIESVMKIIRKYLR
ncbi:MAG: ATP-binding protein [Defluviitaleaceae bacterium]|nr:ATP-binding protein [Defluviitaleaceae bacterium]